jgi:adenylate cyclase
MENGESQRRESNEWMTFLFCSIDRYMLLAETMELQNLIKLLNDYCAVVADLVLEHKGMIDKFIGDKIFACWGAPSVSPDQGLFACKCAVSILDKVKTMTQSAHDLQKYSVRIGISSGMASKAVLGNATLKDYTVVGDAVNIAHALEGLNKKHQTSVLIAKSTYDNVQNKIVAREIGDEMLKSKTAPVTVYELLGIKTSA